MLYIKEGAAPGGVDSEESRLREIVPLGAETPLRGLRHRERGVQFRLPPSGFEEPLPRVTERNMPEGRQSQPRNAVAHLAEGILHPEHVG